MTKMCRIVGLAVVLMCVSLWPIGCANPPDESDRYWTSPLVMSSSVAGLGGAIVIHKLQDTLLGIQMHKGSVQIHALNRTNNSWLELPVGNIPSEYPWYVAAVSPQRGQVLVPNGYAENEHLVMKALMGTITPRGSLYNTMELRWATDQKALFGEAGPNVSLTGPPVRSDPQDPANRVSAGLGIGMLHDSEVYIPFSFIAKTYFPPNTWSDGPFCAGVFHSRDSGKSWQMERVSSWEAWAPVLCRTEDRLHYFAHYPLCLWSSDKPAENGKWDRPTPITKTLSIATLSSYDAAGDGGTAHICWMDRRHNKWRFNVTGPPIENNDIYYRSRKDSDSEWGKDVWLSKGLLYCYAPVISAEGNNLVVAWAGIQEASKQHTDMGPNDIYYVTSRDAGATWTKPLKVTDGAKNGITAGMPQVALLNGTIHLLYIQGAHRAPKEISSGLKKLGLDPWPIYYTQRPFPE